MKTLDTLVDDVYGLFSGDYTPSINRTANLDDMSYDIVQAVITSLETAGKPRESYLRMSNIGKPDKQLWYEHQKDVAKEELRPDTYIKFLYGHIIEALLLFLVKEAGHEVTHEQAEVEIDNVKGHMDAMIDGIPVDVKSTSKFGFQKFVNGELANDDPFGYIAQISAYAQANNKEEGAFLVMEKSLGKLTVMNVHSMEMIDAAARIAHMKEVVESETPPDRCYEPVADGKSGNEKLCVSCSYCPYKEDCWSDANDGEGLYTYLYSTGPRYLVTVVREPKVERHLADAQAKVQ
jgi:hypothetical protein